MCGYGIRAIGRVESVLTERADAPRQPDEGAPDAWVVVEDRYLPGLDGLRPGDRLVLVTWLDRSDRDTLTVHPRGDTSRPRAGVFATRAPDRPNPIGLHDVRVLDIVDNRLHVQHLEALDGTPVLDIKPALTAVR